MTRTLLALSLLAAGLAQAAPIPVVPPSDVVVTPGKGVTVSTTRRTGNTSKAITLTVNKQDTVKVVTPAEPTNHHGGIHVDETRPFPAGQAGVDVDMLAAVPFTEATSTDPRGDGAFRTACNFVRFGNDDPIVYPGQPELAHLHTFFGFADAFTTGANVRTSIKRSSCRGGTIDKTQRWHPAMIDEAFRPVVPQWLIVYYKTGDATWLASWPTVNVQPLPERLVMISGDATNADPAKTTGFFTCMSNDGQSTYRPGTSGPTIPRCAAGDLLRQGIEFPQCWDGKNVDSANHKSHMAKPIDWWNDPAGATLPAGWNGGFSRRCPSTHPVVLPLITFFTDYPVPAGADTSKWRLASDVYDPKLPGGASLHADWMEGWEPTALKTWGVECMQKRRNCGSFNLGDGRQALEFQGN